MKRHKYLITALLIAVAFLLIGCNPGDSSAEPQAASSSEFVFGLILVGPRGDKGWSESHYDAGLFVEENMPAGRMILEDLLNPADRPETSLEEAVDGMVAQGAQLIFTTSDDFYADTILVAEKYPDVTFIHISGDHVLTGDAPPNLGNLMAQMEFGKMIAGCAAALQSNSGSLGYLGPLINNETRRLANATYLGARYCWENYRGQDPADLNFIVEWIGFWFHIPGVTADPTEITHGMYDSGVDVTLSGIDTTESLSVAATRSAAGERVWNLPHEYSGACDQAPDVCVGVPYYNWGGNYLQIAQSVQNGSWQQSWDWVQPDWSTILNSSESPVAYVVGPGFLSELQPSLDQFISGLGFGAINLYEGPLIYQDGSSFVASGQTASPEQIWYTAQLLDGMVGISE
jgi:simple sugar transport system substrate-binding protein